MTLSFDERNEPRLLDSTEIQYGKFLQPPSSEHPISVRLARIDNHILIVKNVRSYIHVKHHPYGLCAYLCISLIIPPTRKQ